MRAPAWPVAPATETVGVSFPLGLANSDVEGEVTTETRDFASGILRRSMKKRLALSVAPSNSFASSDDEPSPIGFPKLKRFCLVWAAAVVVVALMDLSSGFQ